MSDSRPLPAGEWSIQRGPDHDLDDGVVEFWVCATDAATKDRVCASVHRGNETYAFGGQPLHGWPGVPPDLPQDKAWHLARIEPREARAKGGTTAILRWLQQAADDEGVWVLTEAKPLTCTLETLMYVLKKYGGFHSPDEDVEAWMVRKPPTPPSPGG